MIKQTKMVSKLKMNSGPHTRNSLTRNSLEKENSLDLQITGSYVGHKTRNLPAMTKVQKNLTHIQSIQY